MIIDSSAIIAMILQEPEHEQFRALIDSADHLSISAATVLEIFVVIARRGDETLSAEFENWISSSGIVVEPVTYEIALLARDAFLRFGKGRHPAALNFGDCFSYALAKHHNEPLLFKGNDFSQTDVPSAAR